jgi:hypothetical protein
VIGGSDDQELSGFMNIEAGFGAVSSPLVCAGLPMGPASCNENFTSFVIDEDTGIGAAVLVLWLSSVLSHVHDRLGRGPSLSAVLRDAKPNVHVPLEITAGIVTHVGDC